MSTAFPIDEYLRVNSDSDFNIVSKYSTGHRTCFEYKGKLYLRYNNLGVLIKDSNYLIRNRICCMLTLNNSLWLERHINVSYELPDPYEIQQLFLADDATFWTSNDRHQFYIIACVDKSVLETLRNM
jgi:hypothetical protein